VEESKFGYWFKRIAVAVVLGLLLGTFIGAFRGSSVIATDLLTPGSAEVGPAFEIGLVGAGRIVLPRNDVTELEGIWGVSNGTGGYGQVAAVISTDAETIERSFRTLTGRFIAGESVTFDAYAVGADPMEAFAIDFDDVRVPGELGVNPAWFIPGERDTWVIMVHGEGLDERAQALRILPIIEEAGFPVLVITYRNDSAAPDDGGFYRWGLSEWQDIEAAMTFASRPGEEAKSFIVYGFGMGATIAMTHLHVSDSTGDVLGVILDSPVLDLGAVVDEIATARGIPALVSSAAKGVARIRFGLEWSQLDQTSRMDQFDVPMLLLQGTEDDVAPVATADEFAAALPGLVRYERFEGAVRTELWNIDAERYNTAVEEFLTELTADDF
jgi:pimeloyl-ACP methyl ester carboxylesterase